jgi:hypothetical protein
VPADLEAIVAAARSGNGLPFSRHYLEDRLGAPDRPDDLEVTSALLSGHPVIVGDDLGLRDDRGGVCRIVCRAPNGRRMEVRVNYDATPMLIVTADWQSRDS